MPVSLETRRIRKPSIKRFGTEVFVRAECSYQDLSVKYKQKSRDYTKQFYHIYATRLASMRDILVPVISKKWGNVPIKKLIDLKEEEVELCVIIGTLFKHQELKPSILREISDELQLAPQPPREHFVDENDKLILEDEQQRIYLVGELSVHSVITGVVCGVLGRETGDGKFHVTDVCWPGTKPRIGKPIPEQTEDRLLVFISGIGLANSSDSLLPLQLFRDWMTGHLGSLTDQKRQSQVVRVIIAGNSVRDCSANLISTFGNSLKLDVEESTRVTEELDKFLKQLVRTVDVDLMPGEFDPANHMLPQQPLHFCMFPKANVHPTLHGVTNPYECEIGGVRILGTSGQPVTDVTRYSKLTNPIDILQKGLEWGHLAPTYPDTLPGYPYVESDPFIIKETPDIYFAGNQPEYQTRIYEGEHGQTTRLICVPSFSKTHTCVVLELATLNCYPMSFGLGDSFD